MNVSAILCLALLTDSFLGEPKWLWARIPHPIVLIGRAIAWAESRFNDRTRRAGVLSLLVLASTSLLLGWILSQFGWLVELICAAILLAQNSLVAHVRTVARDLRQSLTAGRAAVAMIVSRDTREMDSPQVARAAIESAAENLSDGVVAPAFWFLVGGLPGMLLYKTVNTADSMIGYRTDRYEAFGWAAARCDDLMNWVPARATGMLLWLLGGMRGAWADIATDAKRHKSPNAGWPEAAMARCLNIALAGPRRYHGEMHNLAWVNQSGKRDIGATEIDASLSQLWRIWAALVMFTAILAVFL